MYINNNNNFQNALLQETSEEWEQCEKKMKDVKSWIEKTRTALESPQNKKRPLRDQLALREKMLADITIQRTKISISVEKLQVLFCIFVSFHLPSMNRLWCLVRRSISVPALVATPV